MESAPDLNMVFAMSADLLKIEMHPSVWRNLALGFWFFYAFSWPINNVIPASRSFSSPRNS